MIALVDYDAGNMKSVEKALEYLGYEVVVTRDRDTIMKADKLILPGVGAFGAAMERIREYGLFDAIREYVSTGKPFLGICLGLQLLFEESEESPGVRGLGIIEGAIKKFPTDTECKVPQIGWNSLSINPKSELFKGIREDSYVYFVHSYYAHATNESDVAATTEYAGCKVHAAIEKNNVFACQFHPEKSSDIGMKILTNFANM